MHCIRLWNVLRRVVATTFAPTTTQNNTHFLSLLCSLGLFIVAIVWYIYLLAPLHLYCPFPVVALGSCGHGVFIADLCMIEMLTRPGMFGKDVTRDMFIMTGPCHLARGRKKWFLNHRRKQAARSLHQYHIRTSMSRRIPGITTMRLQTPISFNNYNTTPPASTTFGNITLSAPSIHLLQHQAPPIQRCLPCSSHGLVLRPCASHLNT